MPNQPSAAVILRRCAMRLREYAERPQPSPLGIPASAGPAAWHAAHAPRIPTKELHALANDADAEAARLEASA